jgi:4a-hydroxytetrahydrobiopterin dehydratase
MPLFLSERPDRLVGMTDEALSRPDASAAVEAIGWRYLLGTLAASVAVTSLNQGMEVAQAVVAACGGDADAHLRVDVRSDRVELVLQTKSIGRVTRRDVELAQAVTDAVGARDLAIAAPTSGGLARPVQALEIAIDALDIAAIRPFWKAVLAYADEPGADGPQDAIVDPVWQGPAIWFQQMDAPRPQRNRIHFDITVSHDEAQRRIDAALNAGGTLVSDDAARSFWILADVEGNEVCVCTWQDRDRVD